MPGLVLFHRKWLIAGDLLLFPFLIEAVIRSAWTVATGFMIWTYYGGNYDCIYADYVLYFLYVALIDLTLNIPLCAILAWLSTQGSVFEEGKRAFLPNVLYIKVAMFSLDLFIMITGIWLGFFNEDLCICVSADIITFIEVTSACLGFYFSAVSAGVFFSYNPLGALKFYNEDRSADDSIAAKFFRKAEKMWSLRLKCIRCCIGINDNNTSIYKELAAFFASFLENRDLDLVPSDVLTGLIIISKKHAAEKRRLKLMDSLCSYEFVNASDPSLPSWMTVENALYYLRYAKFTYGWPILMSSSPYKLCSSVSRRCFGCLPRRNSVTGSDDCCYCNITAIKKATGFSNEELVYASYCNAIYEPAFFVAIDKNVSSVIIGIRGTFSLSDLVTDWDMECETLKDEQAQAFFCHRGVLRSAEYVYGKLNGLSILRSTMAEHPDYNLVLTGHSLGGSIAAVLGLLLRPQYPSVQCYTFGPLATLSFSGIKTTYNYVFSLIVGDDIVPRLCVTSCEELRMDLIHCLRDSTTPKYKILLQAFVRFLFNQKIFKRAGSVRDTNLFVSRDEKPSNEMATSSQNGSSTKTIRLYAPGRVLYLEKTPDGVRSLWKTGFHFQRIIISPGIFLDHQPRTVQRLLQEVSKKESFSNYAFQMVEGLSDADLHREAYAQTVDISDEGTESIRL